MPTPKPRASDFIQAVGLTPPGQELTATANTLVVDSRGFDSVFFTCLFGSASNVGPTNAIKLYPQSSDVFDDQFFVTVTAPDQVIGDLRPIDVQFPGAMLRTFEMIGGSRYKRILIGVEGSPEIEVSVVANLFNPTWPSAGLGSMGMEL